MDASHDNAVGVSAKRIETNDTTDPLEGVLLPTTTSPPTIMESDLSHPSPPQQEPESIDKMTAEASHSSSSSSSSSSAEESASSSLPTNDDRNDDDDQAEDDPDENDDSEMTNENSKNTSLHTAFSPPGKSMDIETTNSRSPHDVTVDWISESKALVNIANPSSNSSNQPCLLLSGRGYLSCLQGSVQVQGYTLVPASKKQKNKNNPKRFPFEAPPDSSWITITLAEDSQQQQEEETTLTCILQIESIPKKFLRKITTSDTTTTTKTTPLDHSIYQPQSVATPVALPQQHPSQAASFTLHLPSLHSLDDPWRPTVIPLAWQQAAREILADYCQTHHRPDHDCFVVAICGGKGVGKSTCLRYLLHQFLNLAHIHQNNDNDMPHLSILDADLGQPELGPPGLVTFTSTLTQPLWTPPHLHMVLPNQLQQQQPNDNTCFVPQQQAYFLGSIAGSQSDTTGYMQSMAALRHSSHASDSPPPSSLRQRRPRVLLVNLDGWVKGLGGELLQALLQQTLQPLHHVIQIQGPTASQQFALSPFPQSDDASAITTRIHEVSSYHCIQDDDKDHPNETGGDSAMRPPPPSLVNGPSPASLRTMRLGTYFLSDEMTNLWDQSNLVYGGIQGLNMARRLAALRPYAVPLHSVRLMDPTKNPYYDTRWSDNSHVDLSTWNATLVGLASSPDDNATRESEDAAPRPPTPWYLVPCHGLGLIRSIDVVKQTLYILTPIPHPQRVTILIKSCHLSLPLELINRGVESECFPYLEFTSPQESTNNNSMDPGEDDAPMTTTPILGTSPIKSRNTLARRNQQPQQHRHHRHRHRTHGHGPSGK